jgi:hypothetical protein
MSQHRRLILLCLSFFALSQAQSQSIENIQTTFDGEKVLITYDLIHKDPTEKFKVNLFSSHDNFTNPLLYAVGSLGESVAPGKGLTVIWDVKSALPVNFDGNIIIKVKALLIAVPKLNFTSLDRKSYKKGRVVTMKWDGGSPGDKINIDLYRKGQLQSQIAGTVDNSKSFSWNMPRNTKKGGGYFIRISNPNRPNDVSNSQTFKIKPRTPFIVKFLPFALLGGAVYFLLPKEPGGGVTPDSDLPGPIDPK